MIQDIQTYLLKWVRIRTLGGYGAVELVDSDATGVQTFHCGVVLEKISLKRGVGNL